MMITLPRWTWGVLALFAVMAAVQLTAPSDAQREKTRQAEAAANAEKERAAEKSRAEAAEFARMQEAQFACRQAVRDTSKFPSKAKFGSAFGADAGVFVLKSDPRAFGVRGSVDLMNGFGAMVPHRYACDVKGGKVLRVDVKPG